MNKVGLFFGSFNPIHNGHLIVAQFMLEEAGLDEVWFVLSPQNPFKEQHQLWDEQFRLKLASAAISDNDFFRLCDVEFRLPRPSYTSDTLRQLLEQYPGHHFSLIMGSDSLESLPRWKDAAFLQGFNLLVYRRAGFEHARHTLSNSEKLQWFDAPYLDISATYVRERLEQGHSVRYLVPESVFRLL
ncbi:MAG: nicotinate-nucleotide adenylyltransferase [Bacteroidetes bacterium]|nr:nicotinate-nucleotide adenylyltransferase [Bacteroidota bacterium]